MQVEAKPIPAKAKAPLLTVPNPAPAIHSLGANIAGSPTVANPSDATIWVQVKVTIKAALSAGSGVRLKRSSIAIFRMDALNCSPTMSDPGVTVGLLRVVKNLINPPSYLFCYTRQKTW